MHRTTSFENIFLFFVLLVSTFCFNIYIFWCYLTVPACLVVPYCCIGFEQFVLALLIVGD